MKATRIIRLAATALLLSCFFAAAFAQAGVSVKAFDLPAGTPLFTGEKTRIEITLSNDSDVPLQGLGVRLEASDNLFFSQGFERSKFFSGKLFIASHHGPPARIRLNMSQLAARTLKITANIHMPHLSHRVRCPAVNFSAYDETAANAGTERHTKDRVIFFARAKDRLGECKTVDVVVNDNGAVKFFLKNRA